MRRKWIVMIVLISFLVATTGTTAFAGYYGRSGYYGRYGGYGSSENYGYGGRWERGSSQAEDTTAIGKTILLGALAIAVVVITIGGLKYFLGKKSNEPQVIYMTQPPGGQTEGQIAPQAHQSSYTSPFNGNGGYIVQGVGYVGSNYYQPKRPTPVQRINQSTTQAVYKTIQPMSHQPYIETPLAQDSRVIVRVADPSWGIVKNKTKKFMNVAIGEEGVNPQVILLAPLQAVRAPLPPETQSLRVRNYAKTRFGTEDEKVYDGRIQRDAKGSWKLELREKKFKFKK